MQFSEREWDRLAGNRFSFQNRLRGYEYRAIFDEIGFRPLQLETEIDPRSLAALRSGLPLDPRFADGSPEELATIALTVVGRFV